MLFSIDVDTLPNIRLIGHISYKKPWLHFTRTINEYILYIVKSGELHIKEGTQKYSLKKGDILLLQPNITHTGFKASCCEYYYVHFKHPKIIEITDKASNEIIDEMILKRRLSMTIDYLLEALPVDSICYMPKKYHTVNESSLIFILKSAVDDFNMKYENYKRLVSCKILDLLIRISREYISTEIESMHTHLPKPFVKARSLLNYLNTEYHKKISSSEIEQLFESDYDYLNRVFQKMTGHTIFNYLNTVRINRAKELIETTPIKFSEVAYLVGIDDPYYFSKLFKKYTGVTPTEYWKKACEQ